MVEEYRSDGANEEGRAWHDSVISRDALVLTNYHERMMGNLPPEPQRIEPAISAGLHLMATPWLAIESRPVRIVLEAMHYHYGPEKALMIRKANRERSRKKLQERRADNREALSAA